MATVLVVDPLNSFLDILAFLSFVLGWAAKGMFYAMAGELLFKPLARRLNRRFEDWEQTHPIRYQMIAHYLENHAKRNHQDCEQCSPSS